MSRKRKHSNEEILEICGAYLSDAKGATELCIEHGLCKKWKGSMIDICIKFLWQSKRGYNADYQYM